ncbi:hypothetical protein AVEN_21838-1 [Araneus ventricosus]|uniref:Uncharacterized protein n=1 Tax=Araneus ventricosus TaxID=182803 RepID=A0A4Y2RW80_ARAVE|nr:hypothetical protein AVEN_21838-1 [Araneus ventricosus]
MSSLTYRAKLATIQGVEMYLPTPYSCLKYRISKNVVREWGEFWDGSQSESGHRIRSFVAGVDKELLITNKFSLYFLTNHGPFPYYLHRLKKLGTLCPWPGRGCRPLCVQVSSYC